MREITECQMVSGVYLFFGRNRRMDEYVFYIGQTVNAVGRFVAHRRKFESRGLRIKSSRMLMLNEILGDAARLVSEARFIAAAQQLELPLLNRALASRSIHSLDLDAEKKILGDALQLLQIDTNQLQDSGRRNRFRAAATFDKSEFDFLRAAEYGGITYDVIACAVREERLKAIRVGRNGIIKKQHLDDFLNTLPPAVSSCPQESHGGAA